ncbi:sestrin-1-like [Orbicella faveolata]|uniref:sestrin-1-like n=1 Tax=Orbicella faveolata TaxID=48498 RepID=UPI0009E3F514|nr:sestrin-1-like [Orbicella faveolata]
MNDEEDISSEIDSLRDLCGLQTRDVNSRHQFLESLGKTLKAWTNRRQENVENGVENFLSDILPCILRLSFRSPFSDIRESCSDLLVAVKEKGIKVPRRVYKGPTIFIPSKEVPPLDTDDEQVLGLLVESFLLSGRVTNVTSLIAFHPQYLECFLKTEYFMFKGEGPLPFDWRCYIAIMGASRHRCCYLVQLYEIEFLKHQGNKTWLQGLDYIPAKLRALSVINKILAHQPWLLSPGHIETLLKGEDNWSLSELVQAIVILVHTHSLCSFVYGCGITPEIDRDGGHTYKPPSLQESKQGSFERDNLSLNGVNNRSYMTELMEKMKEVEAEQDALMETTQEELFQQFEKVESGEVSTGKDKVSSACDTPQPGIARYLMDTSFGYSDFASRNPQMDISTFRVQDYSWEEHGFSLINRLYPDMGQMLDDKFSCTFNLTYNTLGKVENVDTSTFRRATWNYIHLVFGIYHDDYLYTEVNKLMERSYKKYIKVVACFPEKVSIDDYLGFMPELTHSEKVHINLLLLESRVQAELLYALRAIMKYMT